MSASEKPKATEIPVVDGGQTDVPHDPSKRTGPGPAGSRPTHQAQVDALAMGIGLLIVLVLVTIAVVKFVHRVEADVNHYEHLYSTLSLNRASIGDVGIFWGGYAAYAGTCLFLFGWLGRFPITNGLWSNLVVAVSAVFLVFVPLFLFIVSIRTGVSVNGKHDVCGSWLYPAASKLPRVCTTELRAASKLGLTFAAAGIVVPIGCMIASILKQGVEEALVERDRNKAQADRRKDRGEEPRSGSAVDGRTVGSKDRREALQSTPEAPEAPEAGP